MADFPLIQKDDKESIYKFSESCYEDFKSYMKEYGTSNNTVSLDEFQRIIFPYKEDMKEYLSGNDEKREEYLTNYADIRETFPYFDYREVAERCGGSLNEEGNGFIRYGSYSPAGQDFSLNIPCKSDMSDFIDNFKKEVANFKPQEEALLWLDPVTHEGKNGAPKNFKDIIQDMKDCQSQANDFIKDFEKIVNAHDKAVIKKVSPRLVGKEFLKEFADIQKNRDSDASFRSLADEAITKVLSYERGSPVSRKAALNEYMLLELDITDGREETFKDGIEKGLQELEKAKQEKEKKIDSIELKNTIFNDLNQSSLPKGISTLNDFQSARSVFSEIVKSGKASTFNAEVGRYFKEKGAFVKMSSDGVNYEIRFESPEKSKKQEKSKAKSDDYSRGR